MTTSPNSAFAVFAAPVGIAAASVFGFAAALLFGDAGQWMSWLGVGAPIPVIVWSFAHYLSTRSR